jgi:hypothetical protein
MASPQRFIFVDGTTEYEALIDTPAPSPSSSTGSPTSGLIPKGVSPNNPRTIYPETTRVELKKVHDTIRGYTEYAIGAFKNLAVANVEELNLKFKLKISTEGGIPMLASGKTEADFEIEVKCKFPKSKPEI